jgi:uncharacterized protein YhdP
MKVKKHSDQFLDQLDHFEQRNEEIKFDLFVQTRRVKQIYQALTSLLRQSFNSQQEDWLIDNKEIVDQLLDDLLDDSLLVLDGVQMDDESKNLSVELMTNIRETVTIINTLIKKDEVRN